MNQNRTGIWIPVWVESLKLSHSQTKLLAEIVSLHEKGGCFASNRYFSEILDLKEDTISRLISSLKKLGILKQTGFDGRKRFLTPQILEIRELSESHPTLNGNTNPKGRNERRSSPGFLSKSDSPNCASPISTIEIQKRVHNKLKNKDHWEEFLEWSKTKLSKSTWNEIQNSDPLFLQGKSKIYWQTWSQSALSFRMSSAKE